MDIEGAEFTSRLQSPEAKEAFMAFAQKRTPDFTQFA
jgi:1,4-dihydroxy-2-naphthoyl-CoA synthase